MSTAYEFVVQFPLRWQRPELVRPDAPAEGPAVRDEVRALRSKLAGMQHPMQSGAELIESLRRHRRDSLPTTIEPLDALLGGGLQRGKLTEIHGSRSSGRFAVVISSLGAVTSCGESAALVDHGDGLDPQLAEESGIELSRLLWVRPQSVKEAVHAAELLLATQFPLVIVDLGIRLRGRRVQDAAWVRLARAAEASGSTLLVSSPFHVTATAAEAVVRSSRSRIQWSGEAHAPKLLTSVTSNLSLEKMRGRAPKGERLMQAFHELKIEN